MKENQLSIRRQADISLQAVHRARESRRQPRPRRVGARIPAETMSVKRRQSHSSHDDGSPAAIVKVWSTARSYSVNDRRNGRRAAVLSSAGS